MRKEHRFTTTTKKDVVIKPANGKVESEAQLVYNKSFGEALKGGSLLRGRLEGYMKEQGLWDDVKQKEYDDVLKTMNDLEKKLNSGKDENGKKLKLSAAKQSAMDLSEARAELAVLISKKSQLDASTAEASADNAKFNFLIVMCSYDYKTQKPLWNSVDEYLEQGDEELAIEVATKFAEIYYGVDPDYEKQLTEYKFLHRFKFINDEGQFIDKDGQRVDIEGNLVKEEVEEENKEDVTNVEFEDDLEPVTKPVRKKRKTTSP